MYLESMASSKNLPRILKKVAAVRRLSDPAWCWGPIRDTWGIRQREREKSANAVARRTWRSSATSCNPPFSDLQLFIRYWRVQAYQKSVERESQRGESSL